MSSSPHAQPGQRVAAFAAYDAGTAADLDLTANAGPVLVYWIKTECPTCRLAMPFVERVASRSPAGSVAVVTQNAAAEVPGFRAEYGCPSVPVFCEPEPYEGADRYGLTRVPTWFVVSAELEVLRSGTGFAPGELAAAFADLGGEGELFTGEELSRLPSMQPG